MRLISVEEKTGTNKVIINADQISSVFEDVGLVKVRMSCGQLVSTKFTSINSAVDYILRAPSYSYVTGG